MCYLVSFFFFCMVKKQKQKNRQQNSCWPRARCQAFVWVWKESSATGSCLWASDPRCVWAVQAWPGLPECPALAKSHLQAGLALGWHPSVGQAEVMACPPGPWAADVCLGTLLKRLGWRQKPLWGSDVILAGRAEDGAGVEKGLSTCKTWHNWEFQFHVGPYWGR